MQKSSRPQLFYKVDVLKNFAKLKKTSAPESFIDEVVGRRPQAYNFIEKETPAQVEVCKILKNTFFKEQLWTTASVYIRISIVIKFQDQSQLLAKVTKRQEEDRSKLFFLTHINKCT